MPGASWCAGRVLIRKDEFMMSLQHPQLRELAFNSGFLLSQQVFLHCQVLVCGAGDTRCTQRCRGRVQRETRMGDAQEQQTLSAGPIYILP